MGDPSRDGLIARQRNQLLSDSKRRARTYRMMGHLLATVAIALGNIDILERLSEERIERFGDASDRR